MSAKIAIIKKLAESPEPLPVHSLDIPGHSQTALSARLRELAREGTVVGSYRPGEHFKRWSVVFKLELV